MTNRKTSFRRPGLTQKNPMLKDLTLAKRARKAPQKNANAVVASDEVDERPDTVGVAV